MPWPGVKNAVGGRPPLVPWEHVGWAILPCFWRGWHTQLDVWRLLTSERVGPFAPVQVCDQAVDNRIERAEVWMSWAFAQSSARLRERLEPWEDRTLASWAKGVYAVDARTLEQIGRDVPWLRPVAEGSSQVLGGQISALFHVRLQPWERVAWWSNARDHCKAHVLTVVEHVQAGALLLFDRGSVSFPFCETLTRRGIWWISRSGNHVTSEIRQVCSRGDGVLDAVVGLGTNRDHQAPSPVRLVPFWRGKQHARYLTNVRDPAQRSLAQIATLDARRWDLERAFRARKEFLNLHPLWSTKPEVIQVQLWCCLIHAQVSHALQVEIARGAGVEVFDVSLDLLIRLRPGWLSQGLCPWEQAVRFGRERKRIRPSTHREIQVPWSDPSWVTPPPVSARQPRASSRSCGEGKGHQEEGVPKAKRASQKTEANVPEPKTQAEAPPEAVATPILLGSPQGGQSWPLVRLKHGKWYVLE